LHFVVEQAYRLNFESAQLARKAADEMTRKSGVKTVIVCATSSLTHS